MKKWIMILVVLMLTACGNNEKSEETTTALPELVEVEMLLPEVIAPNEEVTFQAKVTQGADIVEDANEVKFEIWQEGSKDTSTMYEAVYQEDGVYAATATLSDTAKYTVQVHVTARDMHVMPKADFTVGDISESKVGETHEEHESSTDHGHGSSTVEINVLNQTELKNNVKTAITVDVQHEGSFLTAANVRYEIWQDGKEDRLWVDAVESNGVYTGDVTLTETGIYQLQVHVQNDHEIHDHKLFEIQVN